MKQKNDMKTFNRRCGEILRFAIDIESRLEFFIRDYFLEQYNYKSGMFHDYILTGVGFERKIDTFKRICRQEGVDPKDIGNVVGPIRNIKKLRNKVAHLEAVNTISDGIILRPRKDVYHIKDEIKLTQKTITKIENEWSTKIVPGILKIKKHIEIEMLEKRKQEAALFKK